MTIEGYPQKTQESIEQFRDMVRSCAKEKMVFLGGAGVSTESGIPDFRSADGLYSQGYKYPPEQIISRSFFDRDPATFYEYYVTHLIALEAKPNAAHLKLAALEDEGILSAVITQNIDGLHQAAGSKAVYELHGSVLRNNCMDCGRFYDVYELIDAVKNAADGIPRCACGGIIKPDVVLYEESLDTDILYGSIEKIRSADLMVIAGTSLAVYPAAGLMDYFQGSNLVIINRDPTSRDRYADLCIAANVGDVFSF